MHVKCVGRCFCRQFVTIISIRRRAALTASLFVPKILISLSDDLCFGTVISVRVSPSMRFFTAPFGPIIAPKNALDRWKSKQKKNSIVNLTVSLTENNKTKLFTVEHEK